MHPAHSVQPRRSGPAPSKNGSGCATPGPSPKYTPTVATWKVSSRPISRTASSKSRSPSAMCCDVTAPSMRLAVW